MRVLLQQKSDKTGMEKHRRGCEYWTKPLGAAAGATLSIVAHAKLTAPSPAHPIRAGIHTAHEGCP
jgi:hypothetical protein